MREIKFRAWNGRAKQMAQYVAAIQMGDTQGTPSSVNVIVNGNNETWEVEHDKVELLQFTGLHDKNGRSIYESDIVSVDVQDSPAGYARETIFIGVIVFEESTRGFCVKLLKRPNFHGEEFPGEICGLPVSGWDDYEYDYFWFDESVNDEDIEVVGNIHENPDLLEADK